MNNDSQELDNLGDFLKRLQWQDYAFVPRPVLPSGISAKDKLTPQNEAILEEYRIQLIEWRQCMESISPGTVLFLKTGKFVLVGHVNENLTSANSDEPEFDYDDIVKIAKLW